MHSGARGPPPEWRFPLAAPVSAHLLSRELIHVFGGSTRLDLQEVTLAVCDRLAPQGVYSLRLYLRATGLSQRLRPLIRGPSECVFAPCCERSMRSTGNP